MALRLGSKLLILLSVSACGGTLAPIPDAGTGPLDITDGGSITEDAGPAAVDAGTSGTVADAGASFDQRVAAATATATNNPLCTAVMPFYWEIGDVNGPFTSGSLKGSGSKTYAGDTTMAIASASKWFYSTYWVQRTHGVLSADDIKFFNFWSGYTDFTGCGNSTTVATCLDVVHNDGTTNGTFEPTTENKFAYGGGHMQKHAALNGLANMNSAQLATEILSQVGTEISFRYSTPQPAGGGDTSAFEYAKMLRKIISGQLTMKSVLGTHQVCTDKTTCPLALSSPAPDGEQWSYSIGHWVETDPLVGDGAFSSAGAFGFYPWIDSTKTLYGILARSAPGGQAGGASAKCGRLIRKAWVTGTAQ